MNDLKTLYFPWAAIQDRGTLKKSLIYFDKVLIVCEERLLPQIQEAIPALADLQLFLDDTKSLRQQGILEVISPAEVMAPESARSIIYASTVDDLNDEALLAIEPPFAVYGDDQFLIDIGDKGAMTMLNYFLVDFYAQDYMSFKRTHGYAATCLFNKVVEYDLPDTIRRIYEPLLHKDDLRVAQFVQAFAISQALLLSKIHGATLFTDDPSQDRYLRLKYESSVQRLHHGTSSHALDAMKALDVKSGHVAYRALESLPDLSALSYEDILEVRSSAHDELERFRATIRRYASSLASQPYEPEFVEALERLISSEINPSILELRAKLSTSGDKVLQRIFKKAQSKEALIPFAVSMFAHLSLPASLLISAAMIGLDAAIDEYFEKREIREANGLSFLFNFERGAQSGSRG